MSKYFYMINIKDVDRVFDYEAYKNYFINKMRRLKKIYEKKS